MEISQQRFVRSVLTSAEAGELERVDALADSLGQHLRANEQAIDAVHVHRAQSSAVQLIVASLLKDQLGFDEEVVLAPSEGFVTHARPDFIYELAPGRGVIAEVERGGTTTNNHDLKDLWKTHIAPNAQHLFLIVPNANWNEAGAARERPFARVLGRLGSFFGDPRREIDVVSLHVFGYGRRV
ncbi:hypothetical protein [Flavimobilis marinus]|uniref:hypothetical protein n=1 Tax=Flavimobilis marinus TaxID=285351 RepID=UPI000B86B115|nr:hypothetical protein [Flavimobilis marinus]